ncbi:MAG: LLM class flavin-dependent oxidoreductase [Ilumatobacteraceae bacterium]
MDVGLVVEGQDGLTWSSWKRILKKVDRLGFASLFRSDHFFVGEQRDSLEAYTSFVLAALTTSHVRFGPLVTPVMFRPPVEVGRMSAHIDDLSGGRFVLGLGIGWYRDEHDAYGVPFPPVGERFDRLEEAVTICRALWSDGPAYVAGHHYSLEGADCRPKPVRGTVPVLIGGVGERRALRIVARHADEWCSECISVEDYARKVEVLERHCAAVDRDPRSIRRSMIVTGDVVPSARRVVRGAVKQTLNATGVRRVPTPAFNIRARAGGLVVGGRDQILETLGDYAELGLEEAIFKAPSLDSDDFADYLAAEVIAPAGRL